MVDMPQEFLLIAGAHLMALLSPGPDFLLVVRTATRFGSRTGILASAGIATANAIYITCAVSGITVMQRVPILLDALHWAGCIYLAYLGFCILGKGKQSHDFAASPAQKTGPGAFWAGLLSGLLNPKNMLFYFSLFGLLARETPANLRYLYGIWMVSVVFVWDALLALGLGQGKLYSLLQKQTTRIEKTTGFLFLLIAGGMAGSSIIGR